MSNSLRPPFPYFGSKMTIAEQIASFFPEHDHYVEPFAGSLSVLLAKKPSRLETVNDLDHRLITFWRVLRERPGELARVCQLTPHSRAEFYDSRSVVHAEEGDLPELEVARRVWVTLTQGRGGTLRKSNTGWRHVVSPQSTSMTGYLDGYVARLAPVAQRLHDVSLECLPAMDVIAKYGREPGVMIFADPPYVGSTRGFGNNYRHEMKSDDEHRELAKALRACEASVVLSGYPSELYDVELYPTWSRVEISSMTGNGVERARTEVLWSNRPIGHESTLFDFGEAS